MPVAVASCEQASEDREAISLESADREQTTEQSANGIDLEDGFSQSQVRATLLLVGLQARP